MKDFIEFLVGLAVMACVVLVLACIDWLATCGLKKQAVSVDAN